MKKKQVKRPVAAHLRTFKEETWAKRAGERTPMVGGSLALLDAKLAAMKGQR